LIAMPQLIVRKVTAALVRALKTRAAEHGHSAEAEHRQILRQALLKRSEGGFKTHLIAFPEVGDDADFEVPRTRARRVAL